jgi:sugar/nucleoside kinase (ribokinase family)
MPDFDLLVIGEINPDLILRGEDVVPAFGQAEQILEAATLTIGSSAAILACGAARLGLRTAFVGVTGDDLFGHFMLQAMAGRGVDTSACVVDPTLATGISVILARPDDRAILTFPGAMPALRPEQIDAALLANTRHVHAASYFLLHNLQAGLPAIFEAARSRGATTSLDTNWDPVGEWSSGLDRLWPHCDPFLPNANEARAIAATDDLGAALAELTARVGTVAVKRGADGAVARRGDCVVSQPALPVNVVDTTGSGDSFDAGFIYGFLAGWPLAESLRLANACGALAATAAGGTTAQPTLAEALAAAQVRRRQL